MQLGPFPLQSVRNFECGNFPFLAYNTTNWLTLLQKWLVKHCTRGVAQSLKNVLQASVISGGLTATAQECISLILCTFSAGSLIPPMVHLASWSHSPPRFFFLLRCLCRFCYAFISSSCNSSSIIISVRIYLLL